MWALRLGGFALGAALGLLALKALQARIETTRLGDQQPFVEAWWLIYIVYGTVVFTMMKRDAAYFAALLAFVPYLLVKRAVFGLWPRVAGAPLSLLLRVFDQGGRTERLFARLEQDWRLVGRITLIAGRDLALRNVAAADFVAGGHESAVAPWRLARVGADATDLAPAVFAALAGRLVPRQA